MRFQDVSSRKKIILLIPILALFIYLSVYLINHRYLLRFRMLSFGELMLNIITPIFVAIVVIILIGFVISQKSTPNNQDYGNEIIHENSKKFDTVDSPISIICPFCGTEFTKKGSFCPECGNQI